MSTFFIELSTFPTLSNNEDNSSSFLRKSLESVITLSLTISNSFFKSPISVANFFRSLTAVKERKKLATDIGDLKNELEIVSDKVITLSRDLRKKEEELSSLFDKVGKVESSIKKVDTGLSKLKTKVDEIPISVPPES